MFMQIKIIDHDGALNDSTKLFIDDQIKFGLSRFAQLIQSVVFQVRKQDDNFGSPQSHCSLTLSLPTGDNVEINTQSDELSVGINSVINRSKRTMDRRRKNAQLDHHNPSLHTHK